MSDTPGFSVAAPSRDAEQATFAVTVDDPCAHCVDHFPGEPIVPAIAELDLILDLARRLEASIVLASIDALRLRGIVRPGDRLDVRLALPQPGGKSAFAIRRDDELLAEGTLGWSAK